MNSSIVFTQTIPVYDQYEIVVAGGGPAGCAAAIAAARMGAKTLLIEATGCLGGMGTAGLVPAWCPFSDKEKIIYRGIAEEIFNASKAGVAHVRMTDLDWVPIDPEHLKRVYDQKVSESGAEVLFHSFVSAVEAENGRIQSVIVSNKQGLSAYRAKVYIDCTGDADLAFWAGATVLPQEEEGGYQPASLCFALSHVDTDAYRRAPALHPSNPNSPIYAILESGEYAIPDRHLCNNLVSPGTVGFNAGHLWDVDNTDPHTVTEAMMQGRVLAAEFHRALKDYQPEVFADSAIATTAQLMGVRESRRILGDYVLTVEDYLARRIFPDEICRNSYYIDVHSSVAEVKAYQDNSGRQHRYQKGESHGVPYRCLTPKGLSNVLVAGRSISTERLVQGSTRVMPVCLCTGEAAGKAASLALRSQTVNVHEIDVDALRARIREDGGYIL